MEDEIGNVYQGMRTRQYTGWITQTGLWSVLLYGWHLNLCEPADVKANGLFGWTSPVLFWWEKSLCDLALTYQLLHISESGTVYINPWKYRLRERKKRVRYAEISDPEEDDDDYWICKRSSDTSRNAQNTHTHISPILYWTLSNHPLLVFWGCNTEPEVICHASFTPLVDSLETFPSQDAMGF